MMCTLARFHAPYLGATTENDIAFTPDIEQDSQIGLIVKLVTPTSSWNKMATFLQEGATLYFSTANRTPLSHIYSLYSVLRWRVLVRAENIPTEIFQELFARKAEIVANMEQIVCTPADARLGWRGLQHADVRLDNFFFPPVRLTNATSSLRVVIMAAYSGAF